MCTSPLISIVLPTYNGSRYLEQAVESCCAQTLRDWELIIVDDCSTDDTPDLVTRLSAADPRIRSIRNAANRKLPGSLNEGFKVARGELLTWTSDDNLYRANALEEMSEFLQQNAGVHVVYAGMTFIDEQGAEIGSQPARAKDELPLINQVGACFLYRRGVQEGLGGYAEDMFLVEDYDFWLRASTRFELAPLDRDLYLYRQHEQSLTAQRAEEISKSHEQVVDRALPLMHWVGPQLRSKAYLSLYWRAKLRSDKAAKKRHLSAAIANSAYTVLRLNKNAFIEAFLGANVAEFIHRYGRALVERPPRRLS